MTQKHFAKNNINGGFSLIEVIVVVTILVGLSYFAIPSLQITQIKSREKLLRQRLTEIRDAIDAYKSACKNDVDPKYPLTLKDLTKELDPGKRKPGGNYGPYLAPKALGNPFCANDNVFLWNIREVGTSENDPAFKIDRKDPSATFTNGIYDIRFPINGVNGWRKAIDGTMYSEW